MGAPFFILNIQAMMLGRLPLAHFSFEVGELMKWKPILFAIAISSSATAQESPVGTWRTYDDADGRASSIVRIEEKNGVLEGYVVKILPRLGHDVTPLCRKCEGNDKNRPVTGRRVLWDMKRESDSFSGGKILDPENGKLYRGTIAMEQGKLRVRSFIEVFSLGRTQTWIREQ